MKRRSFLLGAAKATSLAGLSALGLPSVARAFSQPVTVTHNRIDTHHHIVPPAYAEWLSKKGMDAFGRSFPKWSAEEALRVMDRLGVASSICSVSTPGVHLGDDGEAREMARVVNEYAANVVANNSSRFGFFATLTLPDVEGAIVEAEYALDKLGADGVVLLANSAGTYVGDSSIDPLMDILNKRKAVVFIHPSALPSDAVPGIPSFVADFLLDTTRAAINICKSGWLEKYPDVKIILSHAGGIVPYAAMRMATACSSDGSYEGGIARLRKFYFDTALSSSPYALPSLLAFADPTHITFGSDWPFAKEGRSAHFAASLDNFDMSKEQRFSIDRGNALKLFPRFR
jgi:predicted TIM-barrel fold metal-dependent hydrolase